MRVYSAPSDVNPTLINVDTSREGLPHTCYRPLTDASMARGYPRYVSVSNGHSGMTKRDSIFTTNTEKNEWKEIYGNRGYQYEFMMGFLWSVNPHIISQTRLTKIQSQ